MFRSSLRPSSGEQICVSLPMVFCPGCSCCGSGEQSSEICALCRRCCLIHYLLRLVGFAFIFLYKMQGHSNIKLCSIFTTYEDGGDSVSKRRHIKFISRGITQKKEYINRLIYIDTITRSIDIFGTSIAQNTLCIFRLPSSSLQRINPTEVEQIF